MAQDALQHTNKSSPASYFSHPFHSLYTIARTHTRTHTHTPDGLISMVNTAMWIRNQEPKN